ncbi:MAG: SAM-dependent methyltransferase [Sulfurimonas sp.]|jgi:SAM-dependent methyltransferase
MYSNIEAIDFGRLFTEQKEAATHKKKDKDSWDKKAADMNKKIHSGYYNDFIEENISLNQEDTLLDVGCGPGTFSLRFAPLVKSVSAFDFSTKMLEALEENAKKASITNITSFVHDMESSWDDLPVCDVVLASRCLEVDDISKVLIELDSHAKKAVYLTYKVGKSYLHEEVLDAIGRDITPKPDYIYLVNVLYKMGIYAEVKLIEPKESACVVVENEQEYVQSISWSLDGISDEETQKAKDFYNKCIKDCKKPPLRDSRWAFISWKK